MAQGDILALIKNRGSGNILINGAFEFDQDKEGGSYSSTGYTLDQWMMAGGTSCLRAAVTSNPYGFVLRSTATAANNRYNQRIEQKRIKHLVGKELTFSIYAQVTSGSWSANPIKCRVEYANALDNFTGTTNVFDADMTAVSGSNIPDGTRRRFYHKFTVTQQMADNGFLVGFGDFTNATNIVEYSMAMLNEGGLAPFERAGVERSLELVLCQAYYEKSADLGFSVNTTSQFIRLLAQASNEVFEGNVSYKVTKRATPSVTIFSGNDGASNTLYDVGSASNKVASADFANTNRFHIASSGMTVNNVLRLNWVSNARL